MYLDVLKRLKFGCASWRQLYEKIQYHFLSSATTSFILQIPKQYAKLRKTTPPTAPMRTITNGPREDHHLKTAREMFFP
jgi:hypothetical protein